MHIVTTLPTELGHELSCLVEGPKDAKAIIVLCHGFHSSKESTTTDVLAKSYVADGFIAVRFDFYGHGASTGLLEDVTISGGVRDLSYVLAWVEEQAWAKDKKIGLFGSSYGGNVVTWYAAEHEGIYAISLKAPLSDFCEVRRNQLGEVGIAEWRRTGIAAMYEKKLKFTMYQDAEEVNTYLLAESIEAPVSIVHGDADEIVPLRQSDTLMEHLHSRAVLTVLPGVGHRFSGTSAMDHMRDISIAWFNRWLEEKDEE